MLDIDVLTPIKTDSTYEFSCDLRPRRSIRSRLLSGSDTRKIPPPRIRFGFEARDFAIRHHAIWDAFYPLFFLTRNGGPLFGTGWDRARIRFGYPIPAAVSGFFVRRAAHLGIEIKVEADATEVRFEEPTSGHVQAFGGGKESRLLLGLLRELGLEPTVMSSQASRASDVPGALTSKAIGSGAAEGELVDRIMPSLMQGGRHLYYGAGLGEANLETPWHQHYDMASPARIAELAALLTDLGAPTEMHVPAVVLPSNLIQRMLHDRYPDLFAGQVSTGMGAHSYKNLHVSLIKMLHGIPTDSHMEPDLFRRLLERFVRRQLADPPDFGYRKHRETPSLEMRAIIWRLRQQPAFATVRDRVPASWDAAWIDYVHVYANPSLDPAYVGIYRQHAPTVDEADPGVSIRRVRV